MRWFTSRGRGLQDLYIVATASSSLVYIDVPFLGVDWKKMSLGATSKPRRSPQQLRVELIHVQDCL